jgi:hypothetical protein
LERRVRVMWRPRSRREGENTSEAGMSEERMHAERVEQALRKAEGRDSHDPLRVLSKEVTLLRMQSASGKTDRADAERYSELLRLVDEMIDKALKDGIESCVSILRALHMEHHYLTDVEQKLKGGKDSE